MVGNSLFTLVRFLSNFHLWDAVFKIIAWCYLNLTPLKSSKVKTYGVSKLICDKFYFLSTKKNNKKTKKRWNIWDKVFKFTAWFIWFSKVILLRFYQLFQKARASTKKTSLVLFCLTCFVRFFGLGNFRIKFFWYSAIASEKQFKNCVGITTYNFWKFKR